MNFKQQLRTIVFKNSFLYDGFSGFKRRQLEKAYRLRREYYHKITEARGIAYNGQAVKKSIRERISQRHYAVVQKELGQIHTFAFVPRRQWHEHLYDELRLMGSVSEFDYEGSGYTWEEFAKGNARSIARVKEMNEKGFSAIMQAHQRSPLDWIFVYASGVEISPSFIRRIQEEVGVPTVNMCLDDKQSWQGPWVGDHRAGQIDLAPVFDLSWTSSRVTCKWYLCEGGRPIYMPEGCNPQVYRPLEVEQDIPVSFIGGAYGYRPAAVRFLKQYGIPIQVYGAGWGTKVSVQEAVEIICRSRINLGMGGIGYSESLTNVKGRDFEVPCVGRGLYLTSFNSDLALHFEIGKEIVCYRDRDEMLELIRYYLTHSEEAGAIAQNARRRCLAEHRWLHRYIQICQILGILNDHETVTEMSRRYLDQMESSPTTPLLGKTLS